MKVNGKSFRSVWFQDNQLNLIDQTKLPWSFEILKLATLQEVIDSIRSMKVRGAPAIGVAAAYAMHFAAKEALAQQDPKKSLVELSKSLALARPTAVNLAWAVSRVNIAIKLELSQQRWPAVALETAHDIAEQDIATCSQIGLHGLKLLQNLSAKIAPDRPLNILTHCNAGWLACVDYGTITAPIYLAHDSGMSIHVWVSETRPRNQGALLTAWELAQHGVPHTVIADNASGHLIQSGKVDLVMVGTDRTTRGADVANKIGTYMKALCAKAHDVPFYAAVPSTSVDWSMEDGSQIEIEQRSKEELTEAIVCRPDGSCGAAAIIPPGTPVFNPAFDVTPRHLVTGLITERGICQASEDALLELFQEQR